MTAYHDLIEHVRNWCLHNRVWEHVSITQYNTPELAHEAKIDIHIRQRIVLAVEAVAENLGERTPESLLQFGVMIQDPTPEATAMRLWKDVQVDCARVILTTATPTPPADSTDGFVELDDIVKVCGGSVGRIRNVIEGIRSPYPYAVIYQRLRDRKWRGAKHLPATYEAFRQALSRLA